jgi:hypothetical protein
MKLLFKFVVLFVLFSLLFVLPGILIPVNTSVEVKLSSFIVVLVVDLVAILYLIYRLNLSGWKLAVAIFIVFWGLQTFMTQIETWFFRSSIPLLTSRELLNLFIRPLITAFVFIPLAIVILKRWKSSGNEEEKRVNLNASWVTIGILAIVYVIIYFVFGYFVAWQFEDLRVFYSGQTSKLGFFDQLKYSMSNWPYIIWFQLLRGFLWVIFALPLVYYLKGNRTEKIIAIATIFSVLVSVLLLVDNPFMPASVRLPHLLEVFLSHAMFGAIIGFSLTRSSKMNDGA